MSHPLDRPVWSALTGRQAHLAHQHGAAVRFILWGALHGAALALHKLWMAVVPGAEGVTLATK